MVFVCFQGVVSGLTVCKFVLSQQIRSALGKWPSLSISEVEYSNNQLIQLTEVTQPTLMGLNNQSISTSGLTVYTELSHWDGRTGICHLFRKSSAEHNHHELSLNCSSSQHATVRLAPIISTGPLGYRQLWRSKGCHVSNEKMGNADLTLQPTAEGMWHFHGIWYGELMVGLDTLANVSRWEMSMRWIWCFPHYGELWAERHIWRSVIVAHPAL